MERLELVKEVMRGNNLHLINRRGEEPIPTRDEASLSPLMPWIVMDRHYCLYHEELENVPCKQRLKKIKSSWEQDYKKFNHPFWKGLSENARYEMVLLMDDFEESTHNEIVLLSLACLEGMDTEIPLEDRKRIANAYVCQILAYIAQSLYQKHHRKVFTPLVEMKAERGQGRTCLMRDTGHKCWVSEKHPGIDAVARDAYEWYCEYMRVRGIVPFRATDKMDQFSNKLCKKVVAWLKEKDMEEQK